MQRWGVFVDTVDTLGGDRCAIYTLGGVGSGTRVGGMVRSGTLGVIRGAGGNCAGRADGSARAVSSSGMVELKMADSYQRACIWSSSGAQKGDAGTGQHSASVSILDASAALSAENVVGISIS